MCARVLFSGKCLIIRNEEEKKVQMKLNGKYIEFHWLIYNTIPLYMHKYNINAECNVDKLIKLSY